MLPINQITIEINITNVAFFKFFTLTFTSLINVTITGNEQILGTTELQHEKLILRQIYSFNETSWCFDLHKLIRYFSFGIKTEIITLY